MPKVFRVFVLLLMTILCSHVDANDRRYSPVSVNRVRVINEGTAALNQILTLIEGAQQTLDLEYFLFRADFAGKIITHALLQKAKEGVKVRMLLDHNSVMVEITDLYAQRLADHGIEVRYFSRALPFSGSDLIWRNHRKLIIADGSKSMFGGRNVGNEYFDQSAKYNFIDRDIYVEGPIVGDIQKSFEMYWTSPQVSKPNLEWFYRERYNGISKLKSWIENVDRFFIEDNAVRARVGLHKLIGGPLLEASPLFECHDATFLSDGPEIPKKVSTVNNFFLKLLQDTHKDLLTETPYFILKHEGYDLLLHFLKAGGNFVMLTNGLYSTDVGLVQEAFMDRVTEPLKLGGKIYVYGGSPPDYPMISEAAKKSVWGIHSKTIIFDQKHTLISSFNLDPRSVNFNHELLFLCRNNPALAKFVTDDIQMRMKFAGQLNLDGKPMDNRYPYFEANPIVKGGIWFFSPLIQMFDEFL